MVECCWAELLPKQVLRDSGGLAGAIAAWPEPSAVFGFEPSCVHQPGDAVATQVETSGPELQTNARCAVETEVPFKHSLKLERDECAFLGSWTRVLLPLPPGVEAAAGHAQLPAEPGRGEEV